MPKKILSTFFNRNSFTRYKTIPEFVDEVVFVVAVPLGEAGWEVEVVVVVVPDVEAAAVEAALGVRFIPGATPGNPIVPYRSGATDCSLCIPS